MRSAAHTHARTTVCTHAVRCTLAVRTSEDMHMAHGQGIGHGHATWTLTGHAAMPL